MPNIKSSIRSVKTDAERRAKNAQEKSAMRSAAKKVEAQAKAGSAASGLLDKAAQAGVISKNAAARKKSKLAKKVNAAK